MSHADFSPWISKNKKELVNSFPQKIALLVSECFFFTPRVLTAPAIQREITTPGGGGGQMQPRSQGLSSSGNEVGANAAIYSLYRYLPL